MHVYGLAGQTEEGIHIPSESDQPVRAPDIKNATFANIVLTLTLPFFSKLGFSATDL